MILLDPEGVRLRSDAALAVAAGLRWPWRAAAALRVVPRFLRDRVYLAVARRRRRWFRGDAACPVPGRGDRERMID
jgi:predicted DCC family thiol-disulfide oxidoreductase YuxK